MLNGFCFTLLLYVIRFTYLTFALRYLLYVIGLAVYIIAGVVAIGLLYIIPGVVA